MLDALEKVVDAAKSARSANAKDKKQKPVVDFLDDVLKDAATMKVKAEHFLQEKKERPTARNPTKTKATTSDPSSSNG